MGDGDEGVAEDRLRVLAQAIAASPHNLVSRTARAELTTRHIPECRAFARQLPTDGPLLDLGSGGGLPGLVIAIVRPDLEVHLLEATGKKAAFLEETAARLRLPVTVHRGRAEELARGELLRRFRIVTARAVAPLQRLVPWAAPYLHRDGHLFAIKGERWRQEIEDAEPVLARFDLAVVGDPSTHPQLGEDPADPLRPRVVMIGRRS